MLVGVSPYIALGQDLRLEVIHVKKIMVGTEKPMISEQCCFEVDSYIACLAATCILVLQFCIYTRMMWHQN